ncbi:MAG TPA: hypothetical protein VN811_12580 [Thermoanaerobaculia bacterium]|nr:hypothetical protein [Thermoanaerobaculia bacterium]
MRRAAALLLAIGTCSALCSATAARAQAPPFNLWYGFIGRAAATNAEHSWLDGGTGRLALGERAGWQEAAVGELRLLAEWEPNDRFSAHLHARARAQDAGSGGDAVGVVDAWAQLSGEPRGSANDVFRLRAGQFFLPTSRENQTAVWASPFTYTLSAINSWIGEEVRPIGLLAEYEVFGDENSGRAGASVFGGNDASGALLAWRGWAMGDRLSTFGETLPLPALPSLAEGGLFAGQDHAGTTPIGSDLDGRPGWAGYLRYQRTALALVQVTHVDTRGDRELHRIGPRGTGEYAWDTRFDQLGFQVSPHAYGKFADWTIAGEHLRGTTAMGVPSPAADVDFDATYLLVSWDYRGRLSATARWDDFATRDRDHQPTGERSDEDGRAWTAALLWSVNQALRLGVEYVDLRVSRPALAGPGSRQDGGRSVSLGLRYGYGW